VEGALWVAAGGALGAASRYGVNITASRLLGPHAQWGTVTINIAGCLLMGFFMAFAMRRPELPDSLRLFLATGILGGFTTFSAFAADFARLIEGRDIGTGIVYVLASVGFSLIAVFLGLAAGRAVF
jgi:fluoride exporter